MPSVQFSWTLTASRSCIAVEGLGNATPSPCELTFAASVSESASNDLKDSLLYLRVFISPVKSVSTLLRSERNSHPLLQHRVHSERHFFETKCLIFSTFIQLWLDTHSRKPLWNFVASWDSFIISYNPWHSVTQPSYCLEDMYNLFQSLFWYPDKTSYRRAAQLLCYLNQYLEP